MQYYFDKEEHNFKTDVPHGNSKTNSRPHKRTKESVKIAIKESILRPKDVVNDCFSTLEGHQKLNLDQIFPKLSRGKCAEDDTIKLIETSKNEMLNIYYKKIYIY